MFFSFFFSNVFICFMGIRIVTELVNVGIPVKRKLIGVGIVFKGKVILTVDIVYLVLFSVNQQFVLNEFS